ncbi:MAG: hypothetical protein FJ293_09200 [Planctomycetes bacterium]|nr:hypothetical protein [Planctomycetota bacterium]
MPPSPLAVLTFLLAAQEPLPSGGAAPSRPAGAASAPVAMLDQALAASEDVWGLRSLAEENGPTFAFFDALLPPLRYVNAAFREAPIVLADPRGRGKVRVNGDGSGLLARANHEYWLDVAAPPITFLVTDPAAAARDDPLLARPLQQGIEAHDVAFKAMVLREWWSLELGRLAEREQAGAMALQARADLLERARPRLERVVMEVDAWLARLDPEHGLLPKQAYCGDIATPVHNLHINASFWRGVRDLGLTCAEAGGELERAHAARLHVAAAALRQKVEAAVAKSVDLTTSPPFVPMALFGAEQAYPPSHRVDDRLLLEPGRALRGGVGDLRARGPAAALAARVPGEPWRALHGADPLRPALGAVRQHRGGRRPLHAAPCRAAAAARSRRRCGGRVLRQAGAGDDARHVAVRRGVEPAAAG